MLYVYFQFLFKFAITICINIYIANKPIDASKLN